MNHKNLLFKNILKQSFYLVNQYIIQVNIVNTIQGTQQSRNHKEKVNLLLSHFQLLFQQCRYGDCRTFPLRGNTDTYNCMIYYLLALQLLDPCLPRLALIALLMLSSQYLLNIRFTWASFSFSRTLFKKFFTNTSSCTALHYPQYSTTIYRNW